MRLFSLKSFKKEHNEINSSMVGFLFFSLVGLHVKASVGLLSLVGFHSFWAK